MGMTPRQVLVKNEEGELLFTFPSINKCAEHFCVQVGTILYRISKGFSYDGMVFSFVDGDRREAVPKKPPKPKKIKRVMREEVELDRTKYKILPYEVKYKHICVTKCPFISEKTIFIGSALCANCKSFRGRDRKTQEVACNRKMYD